MAQGKGLAASASAQEKGMKCYRGGRRITAVSFFEGADTIPLALCRNYGIIYIRGVMCEGNMHKAPEDRKKRWR